jgi:hypothetical protein
MEIFSFYGEFGLFNLKILGLLEYLFEKYPFINLKLSTYDNYKKILLLKFKNNITFIDKYDYEISRANCWSPLIGDDGTKNIIHLLQSILLYNNNDFDPKLWETDFYYFPMKEKLFVNNPMEKKLIVNNQTKKNICIFPRKRPMAKGIEKSNAVKRNIDKKTVINIIEFIKDKHSNYNIYILGHLNETIDIDCNKYNIKRVDDITESVKILNNCDLLFSPCSGYIDFAKNCGVHNIILLCKECYNDAHSGKTFVSGASYHRSKHPFEKCNIKYIRYDHENYIENIQQYIDNTLFDVKQKFLDKNNLKKKLKIKKFKIIGNILEKIREDHLSFSIKKDKLDSNNKIHKIYKKEYKSSGIYLTIFNFINKSNIYFEIVSNKSINPGLRYYNGKEWSNIENIKKINDKQFQIKLFLDNYKSTSPPRISFDNIEDSILTIKNIKIEYK